MRNTLTLLFVLLSFGVSGQNRLSAPVVTGKVVDRTGGKPIAMTSVWGYEEGRQQPLHVAYAKADGSFAWQAPKTGKYKLVFRAEGYLSDSLAVDLTADADVGSVRLRIDMLNATLSLDSVVVTRAPLLVEMADRYVYDVSRDPDAKRMKMTGIMDKIPGLNSNTADGRLEYAGMKFSQILIDGEQHEMINSGTQFPMHMIRGDVMDKIEVIPPGSPQYDNKEPILNIITSRPLPNGVAVETKADAATDNSYGGNVNMVSKIRDKVVLRFGYGIGYASSPTLHSGSQRDNLASDGSADSFVKSESESWNDRRSHNFTLRGSTKLWDRQLRFGLRTSTGINESNTELHNALYDALWQETSAQTVRTKSTAETKPVLSGDLTYYFTKPRTKTTSYITYRYDADRSETSRKQSISDSPSAEQPLVPLSDDDRTQRTHTVRWHNSMRMGNNPNPFLGHRLITGALYANRDYDYLTEYYDRPRTGGMNYRQQVAELRQGYEYMGKGVSASVSVLLGYEDDRGTFRGTGSPLDYSQFTFNPSGRAIWSMNNKYGIIANYSGRSVRPSFDRLDPFLDSTDPMNHQSGNPDLKPERMQDVSLGMYRRVRDKKIGSWRVEASVYYQTIGNAIERVSRIEEDGVSMTTYENIGRREKYGLKLDNTISIVPGDINLFVWAGYGIMRYHSPDPNVDGNRVAGFDGMAYLLCTPWKGGSTKAGYSLLSNMDISQADRVFYNHSFSFEHSQVLVKNKLFASVIVSNPFESRMTVRNEITGTDFRMTSWRERLGRVFGFSLRCNFGRLKDRVADAEKMPDDTSRE